MSALDAPEVIKRGRSIHRKKLLLKWGVVIYFCCIWSAIITLAIINYNSASSSADSVETGRHLTFSNSYPFLFIWPLFILVAVLVFYCFGRNPLRGTQSLPEGSSDAPASVRKLRTALESVSIATGRPLLECLVISSTMPNALAVIIKGKPYIVITSGLLESNFTQREMTALIAHEAAHIAVGEALSWRSANRLYFTLAIFYVVSVWLLFVAEMLTSGSGEGIIGSLWFAVFLALAVFPMLLAFNFERVVSRQDDMFADTLAVSITRDPDALISAMKRVIYSKGSINFSAFKKTVKWGTQWGQVTSRYGMPIVASKYFFVNPLYIDPNLLVDTSDSLFSRYSKFIPNMFLSLGDMGLEKQRNAEKRFMDKRLNALKRIKGGEMPLGA
ncbi:MAG: M48 family metalloprotease [Actinobacteria bacterium]|nr:M48 family metalloprotease [Actinomycetota bacterium]